MSDIDPKKIPVHISYDKDTGEFIWLAIESRRSKHLVGKPAGCWANGRRVISIFGKQIQASRIAWAYMTGEWPNGVIDHIDGNPRNNRFDNLRDVPHGWNSHNTTDEPLGKSGLPRGVRKSKNKFTANIKVGGERQHLGTFKTIEEADAAYRAARQELHAGITDRAGEAS